MVQKTRRWRGGRKKKRGRCGNKEKEKEKEKEQEKDKDKEELVEKPEIEPELPLLESMKLTIGEGEESFDEKPPLSEIDIMIQKGLEKSEKSEEFKNELPSSNASDDSRSSFNDRKSKDSNLGSPSSESSKVPSKNGNANENQRYNAKRDREWDTSIESEYSDTEAEYLRLQKKQRRPKTRKLESNPLFWSVDDVFRYLRKTTDCKDIAHRVKQEVSCLRIILIDCF